MFRVIEKLAAEGLLTDEDVVEVGHNVRTFLTACKNPAFLKEAAEKLGFLGIGEADVRRMANYSLIGAGMTVAGAAATDAYRSIRDSLGKSRAYKAMIDENPQLAEHDARQVQKAFDTLFRFNPQYAKDPSVAGQYVADVIDIGRTDLQMLGSVIQARKNLADATKGQLAVDPAQLYRVGGGFMAAPKAERNPGQTSFSF